LTDALRSAVAARFDDLCDLTARLVRERSVLGDETGAIAVVHERLERLGFAVERVAIDPEAALADPHGGYPALSYEGRTNVAGRLRGSGGRSSLHLSGHVDVVPADGGGRWTYDPWGAEIADGRMWGRGAGDMKSGIAAYLIAVEAFLDVCGPPAGDLLFTAVIEEECGGNGMRAVLGAGYDADETLIAEPFWPDLGNGGVGVIWARLEALGSGKHAAHADEVAPPVDALIAAVGALRALEAELNDRRGDRLFSDAFTHPYNLNLGVISGGVWPSSVPTDATLRIRLGFGRDLEPVAAQQLVAERVAAAAPSVRVTFDGFRAHAYHHDPATPLADVVSQAHEELHGARPRPGVFTGTTDARYVTGPCYCYGPLAGNLHGIDEWVDLASCRSVAETMALVLQRRLGS
jgi:acetylornithine deacetylase